MSSSNRHAVPERQAPDKVLLELALISVVSPLKEMLQEVFPICSLSRTLVLDCLGCSLLTKQEMKEAKVARQHDQIG